MNKLKYILPLLLITIIMSACERRHKQDVLILYPNWADGIAITHLAKVMLEEQGHKVALKRIEIGPIFTALSRGDADVYMDAWLPNTHMDYWNKYGDKLDLLGTAFDNGMTGLVVPDYVDIESIEDLNNNSDKFGNKIYGIASGAGISVTTETAIKAYNLDYTQVSSSETSMITVLKKAIKNKEWVVITGWKPHYMWSEFDLKPLDDPKKVYPADKIQTISRKGFKEDQPEIANFLANFNLSEELLNELMTTISESHDPETGAKIFYNKHRDKLNEISTKVF